MSEAEEAAEARRGSKRASAFRTIGEVAEDLDVPTHVLRFWETKFTQLKPLKRGGGRRYYRPEDIVLLRRIRQCLYQDGYTIRGVQKLLDEGVTEVEHPAAAEASSAAEIASEATLFPLDPVSAGPEPDRAVRVVRRVAVPPAAEADPPSALSSEKRAALEALRRELVEIRAVIARLFPAADDPPPF